MSDKKNKSDLWNFFYIFFFLRHGWKTPVGIRGPKNILSVAFEMINVRCFIIPYANGVILSQNCSNLFNTDTQIPFWYISISHCKCWIFGYFVLCYCVIIYVYVCILICRVRLSYNLHTDWSGLLIQLLFNLLKDVWFVRFFCRFLSMPKEDDQRIRTIRALWLGWHRVVYGTPCVDFDLACLIVRGLVIKSALFSETVCVFGVIWKY